MPNYVIGIGANVGDARVTFEEATSRLSDNPQIKLKKRSGIYETRPVGEVAGGTFSNAVFSLNASHAPTDLLDLLQEIESSLGRTRGLRWGPRSLDLDILFADQTVVDDRRLTIPHPASWYRRFVLDPLTEIEPTLMHPLLGETTCELKCRLDRRPVVLQLAEHSILRDSTFPLQISQRFPEVRISERHKHSSAIMACLRLHETEPPGPRWNTIPVADLTACPGSPIQRVIDFCTAILDAPIRVRDW